jgi:hypothetical protein
VRNASGIFAGEHVRVLGHAVYPVPISGIGISSLRGETIEIVVPHMLNGDGCAAIWSEVLGWAVFSASDDLVASEQQSDAHGQAG